MGGKSSKTATTPPSAAAASPAAGGTPDSKGRCCGGNPEKVVGMARPDQRKCRDTFACLIFFCFWIGMIVFGAIGLKLGEPARLVYGTDYKGNVCGSGDMESKRYTHYPRVNDDFLINLGKTNPLDYKFYGVCVSTCPSVLDVVCNLEDADINAGAPYTQDNMLSCFNNGTSAVGVNCGKVERNCWVTPLNTSSTLFRCIPVYGINNTATTTCVFPETVTSANDPACVVARDDKSGSTTRPARTNQLFDAMNTARQLWGRWFGDLARAWWVILVCAVGGALVLGFLWLLLAKWFTGVFVWGTIIIMHVALGFLTGYFYYKAGLVKVSVPASLQDELNQFAEATEGVRSTISAAIPQHFDTAENQVTAYKVMAYVFTAITIIVFAMTVALRRSIRTAILVIKNGAKAMQAIPSLLVFPFTTVLALAAFLLWWIFVAASLATSGDLKVQDVTSEIASGLEALRNATGISSQTVAYFENSTTLNSTFSQFEDRSAMNYLLIYHFFGLLWTVQFIQGFAIMTMAGAICAWYFSRVPTSGEQVPTLYKKERFPLAASFCRTLRYSLGTIAFGSLLIAIMQFIRAVMAYIQRTLKNSGKDSRVIRLFFCIMQCCLLCIQKCLELITRNAYIYAALKGTGMCQSGAIVFKIIINNMWTMAAINVLSEIIMFLGKALIATLCAWFAYAILDNASSFQADGATPISATWLVVFVTLFFAYAVATAFMMVFDIAIDANLICFVVDKEENGVPKHYDGHDYKVVEKNAEAAAANKEAPIVSPGPYRTSGSDAGVVLANVTPVTYQNAVAISPAAGTPAVYANPAHGKP